MIKLESRAGVLDALRDSHSERVLRHAPGLYSRLPSGLMSARLLADTNAEVLRFLPGITTSLVGKAGTAAKF